LIDKEYQKYKYVELSSFTYTFLKHTDYKGEEDFLTKRSRSIFSQNTDGRILNVKTEYQGQKPSTNRFNGNLYILIGGLSFSGGSEFAALAKNYTNAKFIGEETGGGYYGNTSGRSLKLTLPNTTLKINIPLHKFVVQEKENSGIPFGKGVLPDYEIQPTIEQYLSGFDAEMEFTKKMINK
jgi:C-terminal processing protease CtpA/Prc